SDLVSNIWIAPGGDATRATPITSGIGKYGAGVMADPSGYTKLDVGGGLRWTPDGRIVFHSMIDSSLEIGIMDGDGRNRKQLTSGAASSYYPSVSADGRYIVFNSERTGKTNLWRVDIDGGNPKQLTEDNGVLPSCSPVDNLVAYSISAVSARNTIWKVSIDGGD